MTLIQFLEKHYEPRIGLEFEPGDLCEVPHYQAIQLCADGKARIAAAEQAAEGNGRPRPWTGNTSLGNRSGTT